MCSGRVRQRSGSSVTDRVMSCGPKFNPGHVAFTIDLQLPFLELVIDVADDLDPLSHVWRVVQLEGTVEVSGSSSTKP